MAKVLIIKLGYSETLDKEISTTTSLGDVLRTTVILHFFKGDDVSWLVDKKAAPLLEDNPYINRILVHSLETTIQLQHERFDTVINLEKVPGICALADSVNAWRRFGFRFDEYKGAAQSYDGAEKVLSLSLDLDVKRSSKKYWQEALAQMIGRKWKGEEYILGYKPKSKTIYDVGFNWVVGDKWKDKTWPKDHWKKLAKLLKGKYSISWQEGLSNLGEYIDWINSSISIVTNDSLGMHLALALKKKVIALFGPSFSGEVYLYNRGEILLPQVNYNCIPCLQRECFQKAHCMQFIKPESVATEIEKILRHG
ncbi:MAG: glycosyltransferase family 9 protein [Candidatus Omnitrophica bacterium]|nr:glycosyltransferase family 9 protein [Candidatus Omnitrophota bacterium]MBU1134307.1 glycosyltransferase family 9 protein [Candidatus Omnitrophota bacterium]MBU1367050.1 glycosyltransferase family 9 protein [Candidatus Omnitrophota bacterium]MBU1523614.1 glycosyltransferase family 9 protein [Candidatus Omnitrophota bacterium]MBU1810988.1 glycosyltransferase family 9 protein [Candidatus Omnitrophota bacterium]